MIKFKEGVFANDLRYPLINAIKEAHIAFQKHDSDLTITSLADGDSHRDDSYHYRDLAFDSRTRHLDRATVLDIAKEIRTRLGKHYDVIIEETHLHIEFDLEKFKNAS